MPNMHGLIPLHTCSGPGERSARSKHVSSSKLRCKIVGHLTQIRSPNLRLHTETSAALGKYMRFCGKGFEQMAIKNGVSKQSLLNQPYVS